MKKSKKIFAIGLGCFILINLLLINQQPTQDITVLELEKTAVANMEWDDDNMDYPINTTTNTSTTSTTNSTLDWLKKLFKKDSKTTETTETTTDTTQTK